MMITVFVMIAGFALLIKGADYLVNGSSELAKRIGVSDLVIGLTVVAFGTSTPELLVNIFASAQGSTEIAIGNVIGSNLFNILLILGVSALIFPLAVTKGTVWKEIPFSLLAVAVVGFLSNDILFDRAEHSALTRVDGLVFLSFFAVFLYYIASILKAENGKQQQAGKESLIKSSVMVIGGLIALILGGKIVVDGAVKVASQFGVSQSLIGLTIVA
ncbi:MAG: sodium:calcium antiporter, partial [Candidatus Omnitrophota bacterium]